MHRLLKPTGSLFVHLDQRVAHYIKIQLDLIFGVKNPCSENTNFINEITWKRNSSNNAVKNNLSCVVDKILFYSKDYKQFKFFLQHKSYEDSYIQSHYSNTTKEGRAYQLDNLTSPAYNNPHSALKKCKFLQLDSCDFNTLAPFLWRLPRSLRHPFFRKGGDLSLKGSPSFNPPTTLISLLLC